MLEPWLGMTHYQFLRVCLEGVGFVTVCYWLFVGVLTIAEGLDRRASRRRGISVSPRLSMPREEVKSSCFGDAASQQLRAEWDKEAKKGD